MANERDGMPLALACCAIRASIAAGSSAAATGDAGAAKQHAIARNIATIPSRAGRDDKAAWLCQTPRNRRKPRRQIVNLPDSADRRPIAKSANSLYIRAIRD